LFFELVGVAAVGDELNCGAGFVPANGRVVFAAGF
jgi:hypothetical protein